MLGVVFWWRWLVVVGMHDLLATKSDRVRLTHEVAVRRKEVVCGAGRRGAR